jgi:cobalt-zinc-cadmium efflux system membrane fusion protein
MRIPIAPRRRATLRAGFFGVLSLCVAAGGCSRGDASRSAAAAPTPGDAVALTDTQLAAVKIVTVGRHRFLPVRTAVGAIDFDENAAVPVFSPYPGRIIRALADVGDEVRRGATLYTIDSPDLLQAESSLIAAAAAADLTHAALERAKDLYANQGMAQKDYQQAVSDEMTAAGALRAARDAVRIFGKSEREIDAVIASRQVDSTLVIASPVSGRITARAAQPGLLVQPGNVPAPYTVADTADLWMLAAVPESDVDSLRVGESVSVRVMALGDAEFGAKILVIGAVVDPTTHTVMARAAVHDPARRLRPGMMATFVIRIGESADGVAIPLNGVVREGDGTMSAWVTTDRRHFLRRSVKIGLQQDGFDQILEGLAPGELAVTDGAILLSNLLYGGSGGD